MFIYHSLAFLIPIRLLTTSLLLFEKFQLSNLSPLNDKEEAVRCQTIILQKLKT